MKTLKIAGLVAIVLIIAALGLRFLSGPEDTWLCQNGQWVKRGQPSAPKPTAACGNQIQDDKSDLIVVDSPKPNEIVTGPLIITGKARGQWFFEASFPVELIASQGSSIQYLGNTIAQARGDWMTTGFVPFEAMLEFKFPLMLCLAYPCTIQGTLVLKKDNPSGLPEYDDSISIPVRISEEISISTASCKPSGCSGEICSDQDIVTTCEYLPEYECYKNAECRRQPDGQCGWTENQTLKQCFEPFRDKVKIFFNNTNFDPEISCNKVFPVDRQIIKTAAVARAALEELLKGPTAEEKAQGYFTNINPGVKIQKLTIADGIARVDFDETLERAVGGSCRVSAIRAEITETLKQFSAVKNVIISINGRTEDILQP